MPDFNWDEELNKIFTVPSTNPTEAKVSTEFIDAIAKLQRELIINDMSRYAAMIYQCSILYTSILVHRLEIPPQEAVARVVQMVKEGLTNSFKIP